MTAEDFYVIAGGLLLGGAAFIAISIGLWLMRSMQLSERQRTSMRRLATVSAAWGGALFIAGVIVFGFNTPATTFWFAVGIAFMFIGVFGIAGWILASAAGYDVDSDQEGGLTAMTVIGIAMLILGTILVRINVPKTDAGVRDWSLATFSDTYLAWVDLSLLPYVIGAAALVSILIYMVKLIYDRMRLIDEVRRLERQLRESRAREGLKGLFRR